MGKKRHQTNSKLKGRNAAKTSQGSFTSAQVSQQLAKRKHVDTVQNKNSRETHARAPALPWGINSSTRVLLVGEGDFSFAASLATLLSEHSGKSVSKPKRRRARGGGSDDEDEDEDDDDDGGEREEEDVDESAGGSLDDNDEDGHNNTAHRPAFARHLVATGFDTHNELVEKYPRDEVNAHLISLASCGCSNVYHGVDAGKSITPQLATKRKAAIASYREAGLEDPDLVKEFDTIAFLFPHVGRGIKDEAANAQKNRELLYRFFRCAYNELSWDAPRNSPRQVIVTLKAGAPYETLWKIKDVASLATDGRLRLHAVLPFHVSQFPGYAHRRTRGFKEGLSAADNEELRGGAKAYVFHAKGVYNSW